MFQKIHQKGLNILAVLVIVFVSMVALAPVVRAADTSPSELSNQACEGVIAVAGGTCGIDDSSGKVNTLVNTIINIFSWVVGVLAVIMLIYGGFRFVTSAGDSAKLTSARQTIIYALVGLVIVVLAQTVVKFVLSKFA